MSPAVTSVLRLEPSKESMALGDVNITTYSSPHRVQVNLEIIPTGVLSELTEIHSCDSTRELISSALLQSIELKLLHMIFDLPLYQHQIPPIPLI
jgi:hypothetical protein